MARKKTREKRLSTNEMKEFFYEFLAEISVGAPDSIFEKQEKKINSLSKKLAKSLKTKEEVCAYLDYVLSEISGLNKFFRKIHKNSIPFSKVFVFAEKDARLTSFLMERKYEQKKNGSGIAGFFSPNETALPDESFSVVYNKIKYSFLFTKESLLFFFSAKKQRVIVQLSNGKLLSFGAYQKDAKANGETPVTSKKLYNQICKRKEKTKIQIDFCEYMKGKLS